MRYKNLTYIKNSTIAIIAGIGWAALMSSVLWHFTDIDFIQGNLGTTRASIETTLHVAFTLLFGVFIAATVYKWNYMKKISAADSTKGLIWWFLWTLVAGCPSCTITVASYIGLASVISMLPWWWLELKIIGLGLMIRSTYNTIKNIHTCSVKKPKN